ncbi:hydantoinase/oxoprolinase family protein [Neochlamydia sp. S13]|jgi:N-methylhydantoinase A/oxoprolinase/acetone carboxylase beta subunit|uniref:hydantoinase/oxoprolinase family protein n=1 Tax=Neochlamydia sp. S13 TaxID=1353976 RepID=UPI0005AB4793|nr:hydantoinase/oxoprolinase family protein [Neochlamydia sp. S13]BBI16713.1 Uncharacterized protein NCS13_1_0518 [Neochlamydia sp. S13]
MKINQKYKIGIDIGGTNTDVVLLDSDNEVIACAKTATTPDLNTGIKTALKQILDEASIIREDITGIFLGTTQVANAIHQQDNLYRVGVIRIAGHHPQSLPSCLLWPPALKKSMYVDTITINGGFECHGDPITPINPAEIRSALKELLKKNIESLAVIGVYASLNSHHELLVKEIAQEMTQGELPISLSHQIGGAGFIERENSTILNAALKQVMPTAFKNLVAICGDLGIACPLWITQNDGSVADLANANEYPIFTISAGPTNSFIGGSRLAQKEDAIVIDIGGTSTDIGIVRKGIPRRCFNNSCIGGVTLNFPMPDVYSIALGGGSQIQITQEKIHIGPKSCGNKTFSQSLSFGGKQLTLTDIALALGYVDIAGARPQNVSLPRKGCKAVIDEVVKQIYELISKIGPEERSLPVIMIGGGSALLPQHLFDGRFIIPPYAHYANAFGAALATISATIDTVVSLEHRQETLEELQQQAIQAAIQKGADFKTVSIVDIEILPYHYIPNRMARVIVKASGNQPRAI